MTAILEIPPQLQAEPLTRQNETIIYVDIRSPYNIFKRSYDWPDKVETFICIARTKEIDGLCANNKLE
jgi:hypothetical protein